MKRILEPTEEIDGPIAKEYIKFSQWRGATYTVVAYDIFEKIRKSFSGKILEIGCGGGLLVKELHKLTPSAKIIGLDISNEMIKSAKKEFGSFPNVKFEKASIYELPYNTNKFNILICQGSLHHFYAPEKALREMLRVVKPNGLIYIQDLRRDAKKKKIREKLRSITDNYQKEREFTSIKASLTKREIIRLMKKLKIKKYKFTQAIFSSKNLQINKNMIESSKVNEIPHMKDLEFILWIKKP